MICCDFGLCEVLCEVDCENQIGSTVLKIALDKTKMLLGQ
jgi:hypothetical protein